MSSVIINDYVANKRVKLYFLPDDFDLIDEQWMSRDRVLVGLQITEFFKGRERWCDLEPAHLRLLVSKNLQTAADLSEEERINEDNPVVASLNFLICALIRCIEIASDCTVETMKLVRFADMEVSVEYTASLKTEITTKPSKKGGSDTFSVIVDNTKE